RCGPNCSMRTSGGRGGLATSFLLQPELRGRQSLALARGTKILPIAGGTGNRVIEAELRKHLLQIINVHARGECLATAGTKCRFADLAGTLVELHAQLGGALEDVEELAKRQIQQAR